MHEREMTTPAHPTAAQRLFSIFIKLYHLYMMKIALIKENSEKINTTSRYYPS
jgi:hypothetical protein